MTNKAFYEFCRDQRKMEPDLNKRTVLRKVYWFMNECGISKSGIRDYIEWMKAREQQPEMVAACLWLHDVFAGKIRVVLPQPQGQATLF